MHSLYSQRDFLYIHIMSLEFRRWFRNVWKVSSRMSRSSTRFIRELGSMSKSIIDAVCVSPRRITRVRERTHVVERSSRIAIRQTSSGRNDSAKHLRGDVNSHLSEIATSEISKPAMAGRQCFQITQPCTEGPFYYHPPRPESALGTVIDIVTTWNGS